MSNAANPTTGTIWPSASAASALTEKSNLALPGMGRTTIAATLAAMQVYQPTGRPAQTNTVKAVR